MSATSKSRPTLRFYFDYVSHNAWLAWHQIHALCDRHHVELEPVPVLFAGLLNAHGQLGPAEVPAKALWMLRDCLRKSQRYGIPLNPPASHPFNPLTALRASCIDTPQQHKVRLITALFEAVWVKGLPVSRADEVEAIANGAGLDGATLVARAATQPVKKALRENTDEAVAAGVFGVPSMRLGDQVFWGFDDLQHIDAQLSGRESIKDADLRAWRAVRPSASRNRER